MYFYSNPCRSENNTRDEKYTTSKQLITTGGRGERERERERERRRGKKITARSEGARRIRNSSSIGGPYYYYTVFFFFLIYSLLTPCGPVAVAPERSVSK
jgi:hypothetical protein|uniref:Transmembrane protein n=1 Tax=Sipha flava TaxID=143950 RepID=A0A2S2QEL7_9HEMI